jgi:hypothetical protein
MKLSINELLYYIIYININNLLNKCDLKIKSFKLKYFKNIAQYFMYTYM